MGLLSLDLEALDKISWILGWNSSKMKDFLHKIGKSCRKNVFSKILKTLERYIFTSSDLCVPIMYFKSSKMFKFLGQFRMGARMHIRPWALSWLIGHWASYMLITTTLIWYAFYNQKKIFRKKYFRKLWSAGIDIWRTPTYKN